MYKLEKNCANQISLPKNLLEAISHEFIGVNLNKLTYELSCMTNDQAGTTAAWQFLETHSQLSMISIATQFQGKIEIIRLYKAINLSENDEDPLKQCVLSGLDNIATAVKITASCFFRTS